MSQINQTSPKQSSKGRIYEGKVIELGPPTSSFAGSKISYLRLQQADGSEVNVPGMIILGAIAPYIRPGLNVSVYIERCCFNDIMFGVKTATEEVVSDDLGPAKIAQYWSYIPLGLGFLTLCLGVGVIFLAIGGFVYFNTRPPKPEQVLLALRNHSSPILGQFGTMTTSPLMPSASSGSWAILVVDGPVSCQRFEIHSETILGRESAAVPMPIDTLASRQHAMLKPTQAGLTIEDLGSTNGTFINGARIKNGVAQHGDHFAIGETKFQVVHL